MSAQPEPSSTTAAFDARWQRIMDCVNLKQPDRMPVALYATFWLARYGGMSYRELMFDYEKNQQVCQRALLEFDPHSGTWRWNTDHTHLRSTPR
mgnify:CR=1 FL=1